MPDSYYSYIRPLGVGLNVTLGYTPVVGQVFTVVDNDGADPISGTFAGLPEGTTIDSGGYSFQLSYLGTSGRGNDVVLVALTGATEPTPTATETSTPVVTVTDTPTAKPSATATATQMVTATPIGCLGDCTGNGAVTVSELVLLVNIALGNTDVSECGVGDGNGDGRVMIDELVTAVNNALDGCPVPPHETPGNGISSHPLRPL